MCFQGPEMFSQSWTGPCVEATNEGGRPAHVSYVHMSESDYREREQLEQNQCKQSGYLWKQGITLLLILYSQ